MNRQLRVRIFDFYWLLLFFVFGFNQREGEFEHAFRKGESLQFKLNYGFLTIGKGSFEIKENTESYNGEDCYRVSAKGATTGLLKWVAPVKDEWGALVRLQDLAPLYTFRNIREGRYQLEEQVFIRPQQGTLKVESVKPHRKVKQRPTRYYQYDPSDTIHDLMSGLLAIRNIDFAAQHPGDTLMLKAFFEDTFYEFQIVYLGIEELKTNFGRLKALKLIPLMPDNSVFDGDQALQVWFSADQNKLPLKITAKMFVGKVSAELISYQNIKYDIGSE